MTLAITFWSAPQRASAAIAATITCVRPTAVFSRLELRTGVRRLPYGLATAEYTSFWTTWSRLDGSGKHVLALHQPASWAGDNTPVYDRLYAGGFRSIRGFEFRGVGPHAGSTITTSGGNFAFLNSLEYQIPIVPSDSLYVVGFIDSGTVEQGGFSLADYRVTAGVGLRISMPQLLGPVPLAIDFGFPLRDAPGDRTQVFSFWIGMFGQ